MRDPARIDRILAALAEHWKANPDLRLGQIVVTAARKVGGHDTAIFYVEDELVEQGLGPLATSDLQAFYDTSRR